MALLTVIIPTYNNAQYLKRCIDSLLPIDNDIQIVVVDDGSTDDTQQLLSSIKMDVPTIEVLTQQNSGVSSARNTGLKVARGRYVLFADADDCLSANALSTIKRRCQAIDSDIIIFRSYCGGNELYTWLPYFREGVQYEASDLMKAGFIRGSVCGCAFSLRFLQENSVYFCPNLSIAEDTVFFACAISSGARISFSDNRLYEVIPRAGSASRRYDSGILSRYSESLLAIREGVEDKCVADNTLFCLLMGVVNIAVKLKVGPESTKRLCSVQRVLPLAVKVIYKHKWYVRVLNSSFLLFYVIKKVKDIICSDANITSC